MKYEVMVTLNFCRPRQDVYAALIDLGRHLQWNHDLIYISESGSMKSGLHYRTKTRVAGQVNDAEIVVTRLIADKELVLECKSGLIGFTLIYHVEDLPEGGSRVTAAIEFTLRNFILELARPVIEGMARDRLGRDLETLRELLCEDHGSTKIAY